MKMSSIQVEFPPHKGAESGSDKCVWSESGDAVWEAGAPDGLKVPSVSLVSASAG